MRKNYILLILFTLLFSAIIRSQDYYCKCADNIEIEKQFDEKLSGRVFNGPFPGNSAQFYREWISGDVILENGSVVKDKYLRYNGYLDELLWARKPDYKTVNLDKNMVKGFVLHDKDQKLVFEKIPVKNFLVNDSTDIFMELLSSGNLTLYSRRQVHYIPSSRELYHKYAYFLYKDGNLQGFMLNRWGLLQLFPDKKQKSKMRAVLRSNLLFVRKEKHLIRAIELYNRSL